jgi:hypothetical protein
MAASQTAELIVAGFTNPAMSNLISLVTLSYPDIFVVADTKPPEIFRFLLVSVQLNDELVKPTRFAPQAVSSSD